MIPKFNIFTDFDGTIALNDVGDSLFQRFATSEWEIAVQDWKEDKISSKECLTRECAVTTISKNQMVSFSNEQKIDPWFSDFYEYCKKQNYPLTVLSDGLDFYIKRILDNFGFTDLEIYANHVVFEDSKIKPEFPYFEKGCKLCANCKGYHIGKKSENGQITVCIGDGYSDRCGVNIADIVFAKDDLKKYCLENEIAFYEYENFKAVLDKFKEIEKQY